MQFLVLFGLVVVAFTKKFFHENYYDFISLIYEVAGDQLKNILNEYLVYKEFQQTIAYILTPDFKKLLFEMEALPEFRAVIRYLENHSIDILLFIDEVNYMLENEITGKEFSHSISGSDFSSFIQDSIAVLPKEELAALYNQKIAEDEDFKAAIVGLQSDKWNQVYSALWASEKFLAKVKTLAENGIDFELIVKELVASFGQN